MAKPDNRADNVEKLQHNVQNTMENLHESQQYLNEHAEEISPQEVEDIREKNERRLESMEGNRQEIKDEARARQQ